MIQLKAGVDLRGISPEVIVGLLVLDGVFTRYGAPVVITSCRDGQHMEKSKHYSGDAIDVRLVSKFNTTENVDVKVLAEARAALAEQFDLVLEASHFHLELDVKADIRT